MKRVINLHPTDNGAEAVVATVEFKDRAISLSFDVPSYGQFGGNFTIHFNRVSDLTNLISDLVDIADEADTYFKENP